MKKILVIISLFLVTGCNNLWSVSDDSKKFKQEYESLNKETNTAGETYLEVNIPKANPFRYLTFDETIKMIDSGTGILMFSRPGCPYCRATLEATLDFAKTNEIKRINYYNPEEIRNLNNDQYKLLLEKLDKYLNTDLVTQKETDENFDETLKRLVVPHIFFINNGDIIYNYQENREEYKSKLNESQKQDIINKYTEGYEKLKEISSVCTEEC